MDLNRPIVLSIAGLDPSGGAGLLADIKTFEQHRVYGLGVTTAQTLQTEAQFFSIRWEKEEDILEAVQQMLQHYTVRAVKIGIVVGIQSLHRMVAAIRALDKEIPIVLDPVLRSTTAFDFWQGSQDRTLLPTVLQHLTLITPNFQEVRQLSGKANAHEAATHLAACCPVLLKGGHNEEEPGVDYLYTQDRTWKLRPEYQVVFPKHGSGCVLSAAITANLASGYDLETACRYAKTFTEKFLTSNPSLLGYHVS